MKQKKLTLNHLRVTSLNTTLASRQKGGLNTEFPQVCDLQTLEFTACYGDDFCQIYRTFEDCTLGR